jgi:DNA-directed RNA polymerase sigma subunit (sigma70/sigma32)
MNTIFLLNQIGQNHTNAMRPLEIYPKVIDAATLLAREQREVEFSQYAAFITQPSVWPDEQELEQLIAGVKKNDKSDIEKATKLWMPNIVSIARQTCENTRLPLSTLIDSGTIGLINCLQRSPTDSKAVANAAWWIRQSMLKHISDNEA